MSKRTTSLKSGRRQNHRHSRSSPLMAWLYKRLRLLFFSVLLVAATLIVFLVVYFYQFLHQGLARAGNDAAAVDSQNLSTGHDFNLLFFRIQDFKDPTSLIDTIFLINFRVKEAQVRLLSISPNENLLNLRGGGSNKVSALYGLSSLSRTTGLKELERTFAFGFGLPVDGVIYTDLAGWARLRQEIDLSPESLNQGAIPLATFVKTFKSLFLLGTAYRTNLTPASFLNLLELLLFHFPQSFKTIEAESLWPSPDKLDVQLSANFNDHEVEQERLKIIVLNGTNQPGLANAGGRLVNNLGLSLITTGNSEDGQNYLDSMLISQSRNYYAVSRLVNLFGIKDLRLFSDSTILGNPQLNRWRRADLVLILGRDQLSFDKN